MKGKTFIWLLVAFAFIVGGCLMFGGVMMALGLDFTELSTVKYESNRYEITDTVSSIKITATTANTVFLPADDNVCRVVCYEAENEQYKVSVENGCLTVRVINEKKWYHYIGFLFDAPKLTVYLPRGLYEALRIDIRTGYVDIPSDFQFGTVEISGSTGNISVGASASKMMRIVTSTGDITVSDTTAGSMDLKVSTGKIAVSKVACSGDVKLQVSTGKTFLTDLTCTNLVTDGNTGDLSMDNVIAVENMTIQRTTGNVKFDACDAMMIQVKTRTGDVTGTLLRDMSFVTKTSTGKVDVPQEAYYGGRCEVTTTTGNIRLKVIH